MMQPSRSGDDSLWRSMGWRHLAFLLATTGVGATLIHGSGPFPWFESLMGGLLVAVVLIGATVGIRERALEWKEIWAEIRRRS